MMASTSQRISVSAYIWYTTKQMRHHIFFITGTKFTIFTLPIIRAPCLPPPPPNIFHNHCLQFLLGITVVPRKINDNAGWGVRCIMVCQVPPQRLSRPSRSMLFVDVSETTAGRNTNRSDHVTWNAWAARKNEAWGQGNNMVIVNSYTSINWVWIVPRTSYEDPLQRLKVRVHSATKTAPFNF